MLASITQRFDKRSFPPSLRHSSWQWPSQHCSGPDFRQCRCCPYRSRSHRCHCTYYFAAHQQIIASNLATESNALKAKANYLTKIGHKVCVVSPPFVCLDFMEHVVACGGGAAAGVEEDPWVRIVLTLVRISFFFSDHKFITTHLTQAEKCVPPSPQLSVQ